MVVLLLSCVEIGVGDPYGDPSTRAPRPDDAAGDPSDPEGTNDTAAQEDTGHPDTSSEVDPDCWSEPFTPDADVSDLKAAFSASNARDSAYAVLERRFPAGHELLVEMAWDSTIDTVIETGSWSRMMESLMTTVHEEVHGWDYGHSVNPTHFAYFMLADRKPEIPWVDGLPRSVIAGELDDSSTSLYSGTYLTGTQGTYGFVELLDETNCYVNGLGAIIAGGDAITGGISGRDGALAFLYYIELYLRALEEQEPALYSMLQGDPDVRQLILDLWLRTHFFLERGGNAPHLGVSDAAIADNLYAPANQQELEDFLGVELAASSCLP